MPHLPLISVQERADLGEDVQGLLDELDRTLPDHQRSGAGECHPAIDVVESERAIEVYMDVAGIPPEAVRLLFRGDVLVIAGVKAPTRATGPRNFHLVEREFGRFARAVRVSGAFDLESARASVRHGELHVVLPKRSERRGQAHRILISTPGEQAAE